MTEDSGVMEWSPRGVAHDLSAHTPQPYYRDIAMPGGFPLTPFQPSAPVFERVRPANDAGPILSASKRICTTAARAASAFTVTTSTSMTAIIRNMPRFRFRARRSHQPETRRAATAVSVNDVSSKAPSQSPSGLEKSIPKEAQTTSRDTEPGITPPSTVKLWSPFPVLKPTYGTRLASPQPVPDSSPARPLAAELDTAVEDSDSSSTFDGNWIPTTPIIHIKTPTTLTTPLSSAVPDTADWYHDGVDWILHSDFTKSPSKHSTTKSRAEVLEEGQGSARQTRRSILKAKIALVDISKFDIQPLSEEWEAKVNTALKNGHGRLQARDFQKIVPPKGKGGMDAWLNDESINEYLGLVTKHANKNIKPNSTPRMHAFSTFFFTSLREGGYKKVARWAKRANLAGTALLDVEKIFIPINPSQSHWTLAVVQPRIQRITHYNSYGSGSKAYLDVICEWLKGELGPGFNRDDWDLDYTTESPQQTNGSDCGVFTVTTAKQIMLGISPMAYGASDIPTQRRRMIAELVNGELLQTGN